MENHIYTHNSRYGFSSPIRCSPNSLDGMEPYGLGGEMSPSRRSIEAEANLAISTLA